jgi:UDP-N-acetylglucosamine 2-epimerase (non-hydrolysing)
MPEEINRILTDAISNYLFTPSPDADANLTKEGIHNKNIFRVGNIMVDSLLFNKPKAAKSKVLKKMALKSGEYALLTLHRPGNVDNLLNFEKIISVIKLISKDIPVVFPTHPRTKNRLNACGLEALGSGIKITGPLGYLDFIHLMMHCKFVLTDSGGAQEETTVLGVPCLTLRETTERPITVTEGTNTLVAGDNIKISREVAKILHGKSKRGRIPKLWDGKTAQRIIKLLGSFNLNN